MQSAQVGFAKRQEAESPTTSASTAALWPLMLVVSPAVEISFYVGSGAVPNWLVWVRVAVLSAVLLLGRFVRAAIPYRRFCAIYGFLLCAGFVARRVVSGVAPFSRVDQTFEQRMIITGLQYLTVTLLVVLLARQLCGGGLEAIYLRAGDLKAKLEPAWFRIAGIPVRWRLAAPLIACGSLCCVAVFLTSQGDPGRFQWRLIFWAFLFAANNAFVEEAIYRSALISSLRTDFGTHQAVAATSILFGLTHWNGIPFGVSGVFMASTFGFLAGKAMVETRGIFWPWFMHMLPDVAIFYFWGAAAVQHP